MLPNNLINGSQTMNGDVGNASAFSPNNLTGNGNSSNNTISGLSPSSSYDSYSPDPRCKCLLLVHENRVSQLCKINFLITD